jgi:hypothetical protein
VTTDFVPKKKSLQPPLLILDLCSHTANAQGKGVTAVERILYRRLIDSIRYIYPHHQICYMGVMCQKLFVLLA